MTYDIITHHDNTIKDADHLRIAMAQIAPVLLNRDATIAKIADAIKQAATEGAGLICFGEALLPGYPFWTEHTGGAAFNNDLQKQIFSIYVDQAINIERRELSMITDLAATYNIAVYLGCIEKTSDRGQSLFCSLVYIDAKGIIQSVHRKLQPTYEERLVWAQGDGHGLRTHQLNNFIVGGLNCWENWMPLSRTSLYAQGEMLHISVWPGGYHNTFDLPLFMAKEGRTYQGAVSGLMHVNMLPDDFPARDQIINTVGDKNNGFMGNGGSCIAAPDGTFLIEPVLEKETILIADIDASIVRRERQNFDPVGHYSRPDVTQLTINRNRQTIVDFE